MIPNGNTRYVGQAGPLFRLAFTTNLLTFITLGIYRFWAKTRLRKYIWSSISVDGDAFEYTGTGLEKLLGFLIAIVFLTLYLGTVQLVLTFVGLGMIDQPGNELAVAASIYLSFFAVFPFVLFAVYRARRYKLARTRLRGIRFGMQSAAWGYVIRAIGHYILTAITLGALLPRQTFYLEKFMTDRSYYGDARFEQGGRWQALYAAMKHIFIGLGAILIGGVLAATTSPVWGVLSAIGSVWFMLGFIYYRVHAFAYLTSHKMLDGQVTFTATPSTRTILKTFILGGLAIGLVSALAFGALAGIFAASIGDASMPNPLAFVPMAIGYLLIFVALGALGVVMITQPVIAHLVTTLHIHNAQALATIHQRASDSGADADGFADALDVGGAL